MMKEYTSEESNSTTVNHESLPEPSTPKRASCETPILREISTGWLRPRSTSPEHTDNPLLQYRPRQKSVRNASEGRAGDVWERLTRSRKTSQFFERRFATRQSQNTAQERIAKDSNITLDIKLNCCLGESESHFHCDLSFTLSEVYQRPVSCIMAIVSTQCSIFLDGTSDPAYYITLTALPSDIAATKNKRGAHFIQQFMREHLNITPDRGVIKFEAVGAESLATNGSTVLQEIEVLNRSSVDDSLYGSPRKHKDRIKKNSTDEQLNASVRSSRSPYASDSIAGAFLPSTKTPRTIKKRKSLMSFFGM